MANGNNHDPAQSTTSVAVEPKRSAGRLVEFDEFIDSQLRKTRSHVRGVDVATSVMLLVAGTLVYLLIATMFDHWIVPGGLGFWGRTAFWAVYLVGAVVFLALRVVPLLVYRINPLYAAQTIERSQPSLKNTLVNFLFFRGNPASINRRIYAAIEQQAASNLAASHTETAVDRTNLIRIGYVLLGILLVYAGYMLLSPKDALKTMGRIAVPWADIDAPTRTTITEIEPRDTEAFRGQQIAVSARIQNLEDDDRAMLYYSTADGQTVDAPLEMALADDGYKHTCLLPAGDASLQQDLDYRIEAGDAITRPFHVEVVAAPTIFVRTVDYQYPTYTGLLDQRVERQGDIKAIEGTEVTVEAVASSAIESAHVDFDCDGKLDRRMTIDGDRAKATFRLALNEDRRTPWHGSYQLIFKNVAGQQNPQPVRHQIEVTRDIEPTIEFIAPKKAEIDLPANGSVTWEVAANDPDFALKLVKLSANKGGQPLFDKLVLDETHRGQFGAKFRFEPARLGLKPGDVVAYSALAEDNKSPRPNRTETLERKIRIISPSKQAGGEDQVAQNDQTGDGQRQPGEGRQQGQGNPPDDKDQPPDKQSDQQQQEKRDGQDDQGRRDQPSDDSQRSEDQEQSKGEKGQQSGEQNKSDQQPGGGDKRDAQQGEGEQAKGQEGESGGSGDATGKQQPGQDGKREQQQGESSVPNDGSNDGDAIERILKHRQDQQGDDDSKARGQQQQREGQGDEQPSGDERRDASDRQRHADQQQAGRQKEKQSGDRPAGESRDGQPRGDDAQQREQGQQKGEEGQPASKEGQPKKNAGDKRPDMQPGDRDRQADSQDAQRDGTSDRSAKPSDNRDENQPAQPARDSKQQEKQSGKRPDDAQQDRREGKPGEKSPPEAGQRDGQSQQGQGGQSKSDPMADKQQTQGGQQEENKGGGQQNKGKSGAGKKGQEQQGSPQSQERVPRDKSDRPSDTGETEEEPNQEQSGASGKRESDSEGNDDGDRSGGGKRGAGQKANQQGTGGAGKNTAADEGAGASEQAGKGETSNRAGRDQIADKQTGQKGQQQGKGSQSKDSPSDQGGKPGSSGSPDSSAGQSSQSPPTGSDGTSSGVPTGGQAGGRPSEPPSGKPPRGPEVADEANLEYARKATDLALTHLKDELAKGKPDQELLDRLGWSRDDLARFVNRWELMRKDAKAPGKKGEVAKRELDETLRSLGLRPKATNLRSSNAREDKFKGLRESRHTSPPPEYAEQTKAYTQGTARGGK